MGDTEVPEYNFTIWTKHVGVVIFRFVSVLYIYIQLQNEDEGIITNNIEIDYNSGITICLST